jgi:uncharacterized coiled-coil protein SlyX
MSDEILRKLEMDVAEHRLRIDSIERLIDQQNRTLSTLSEQFAKLQNRLTVIGSAAVAVLSVSSEPGGALIRALLGGG